MIPPKDQQELDDLLRGEQSRDRLLRQLEELVLYFEEDKLSGDFENLIIETKTLLAQERGDERCPQKTVTTRACNAAEVTKAADWLFIPSHDVNDKSVPAYWIHNETGEIVYNKGDLPTESTKPSEEAAFEEWLSKFRGPNPEPLPLWVCEKLLACWHAALNWQKGAGK